MKFKTFLAMYKNIIILVWWLMILVIFKIWNNFVFENGSSLLFVFLIVVLPLTLYIFGIVYKNSLLKQKSLKKKPLFENIQSDYEANKLQKIFSDEIEKLKLNVEKKEEKIMLHNNQVAIVFERHYSQIKLIQTKVVYYFYYGTHFTSITSFDQKMLQFHSPNYLYNQVKTQLAKLLECSLTYMENKKCYKLIDSTTNKVLYDSAKKPKAKQKYNKVIQIELLK